MDPGDLATWIAAFVALVASAFGWRESRRANAAASQANRLSREANELAVRSERRATERGDVVWQGFLIGDDWLLENQGVDSAFDVHVQVQADLSEVSTHAEEVPPAGQLRVDLSEPTGMIRDQYEQLARAMQEAGNRPP